MRYRVWSADRLSGSGGDFLPIALSPEFEVEMAAVGQTVVRSFIDARLPLAGERFYRVQTLNE